MKHLLATAVARAAGGGEGADAVNAVTRTVFLYFFGALAVVILTVIGLYALYRAVTGSSSSSPAVTVGGGLLALAGAVGLTIFGYVRLSQIVDPLGMTAGAVLMSVLVVVCLVVMGRR